MKKFYTATIALLMMVTSCNSPQQLMGVTAGASLGSLFGSSIGGIVGHSWRSRDAGRLIGMVVGGAVGAAVTAPKTDNGNYSTSRVPNDPEQIYHQNNQGSPFADLSVENVRFIDNNYNESLEAGEHAQLVFEVHNLGDKYVYDIAPVITVSGTKHILISPSAIISELAPGGAVRYKAEMVGTNKLNNGTVEVNISLSNGKESFMVRSFELHTLREYVSKGSTGRYIE
ncbi:MAG: hypothetical protein HUK11_09700 [Muribaculaceae bacterium]|nr:hypothetical protein [Muribaculaceae bacterium]